MWKRLFFYHKTEATTRSYSCLSAKAYNITKKEMALCVFLSIWEIFPSSYFKEHLWTTLLKYSQLNNKQNFTAYSEPIEHLRRTILRKQLKAPY